MKLISISLIALATVALALPILPAPAAAAVKSEQKTLAEPRADQALVYLIREKRFQASARTMFVYADETHVATLDNDCYSFAYLEPGERLLWLNWATVSNRIELEAGETYFFRVRTNFENLPEDWGRALIEEVGFFCTPSSQERATAQRQIAERHSKAVRTAKEGGEYAGSERKLEKQVAAWPEIDLGAYPVLCVENFAVTDPEAGERKDRFSVESAPERIADRVAELLREGPFEEVVRGPLTEPPTGTVMLRAEITHYRPEGQTMGGLLAGKTAAGLEFTAQLIDAATGRELTRFSATKRKWIGGSQQAFGISDLERNMAYKLALYLRGCRG